MLGTLPTLLALNFNTHQVRTALVQSKLAPRHASAVAVASPYDLLVQKVVADKAYEPTAAHGALSYTNAAAATDDGRVYTWGGNCWQGGIAAGRNATGPTEVAWGGVPSCYRCASVALGHQHGFLIFEKRP